MGKHNVPADLAHLYEVVSYRYHGKRMHGVPEQQQRLVRGEIRYTVETLSRVPTTWYRIGVGIWEPVTP